MSRAVRAARSVLVVADFAVHGPFLTGMTGAVTPRTGHLIARLLGLSAAHAMFCACCPDVPLWADADEVAAS